MGVGSIASVRLSLLAASFTPLSLASFGYEDAVGLRPVPATVARKNRTAIVRNIVTVSAQLLA
jgi:hypothetical protein